MVAETEWTDAELQATVTAYLDMLRLEREGASYSKAEIRRQLRAGPLASRSDGSVEYRMQNISRVMEMLGRPRIAGYKPASNIGSANETRLRRMIEAAGGMLESSRSRTQLSDVALSADAIMGVKAVFGPLGSHVLCFGARGSINERSYFQIAAGAARRAEASPFVVTIGGGRDVRDGFEGRVLNVAKVAQVYGLTRTLVTDPEEVARLTQWPVAIALHDVWRFVGAPHLVGDLGFPDRTILAGSQDGIVHPDAAMERLWEALREWPLESVALPLPGNFYDPSKPTLVTAKLPKIPAANADEGERVLRLQLAIERKGKVAKEAKRLNRERYGVFTCEACSFAHSDAGMFDAHHQTPLAVGKRTTLPEHLLVLCPTCHRRAHRNSSDPLDPYTLEELRAWAAGGRT
ncbi:HNH endonuclease [Methylobacterium sp. 17Sr1-1]|uniref:HNH endonuclease n=1 Tax=Methylobacterium sp. 17Sr1-1 TaxID=2202826 RepID=UPI000D6F65B3|nr:HNH endonuclease [Methylobacterium sp. 17Sr1-1]AWN52186.1 hypothetical protein DK412_11340 [Methylobacterium sp. 17Sr1-1]